MLDHRFKQRLIGMLVLSILVLMTAPILFDAEGRIPESIQRSTSDSLSLATVPKTVTSTAPVVVTEQAALEPDVEDTKRLSEEPKEIIEITESPLPEKPVLSPSASSERNWTVQVASFRDAKKASQFEARLREADFKPYLRERTLSDGSVFTQVFVGPVATKTDAVNLKELIKTTFNEQGLVVRYKAAVP